MNCDRFQEMLPAFLEDSVRPEERIALERHLAACRECQTLVRFVRSEDALPVIDPPSGMLSGVLERTSGQSACHRAQELLFASWDERLSETDAELLGPHVAMCGDCAALSHLAQRIPTELSHLQSLDPGEFFTRGVLAATAERLPLRTRWRAAVRDFWQDLSQRPRVAWEGAFVGMLLFLVFYSMSDVSLGEMARKTIDLSRTNMLAEAPPHIPGQVSKAWDRSGGVALEFSQEMATGVTTRLGKTEPARKELRRHTQKLIRSVLDGDLNAGTDQLGEIRKEVGEFWNRLNSQDPSEEGQAEGEKPSLHEE